MPTKAAPKPRASGGGIHPATFVIGGAIALIVGQHLLANAGTWWDAQGSPALAAWLDAWQPRLVAAGVALAALVVLVATWRVRRAVRSRPTRKARSRAEMRQPARPDGTIPAVKPVVDDGGKTTALVVTLDPGEIPSMAFRNQTAEAQGLGEWGVVAEHKLHINKGKDPLPQLILTPPAADTRDALERQLEEIAMAALPDVTGAKVAKRGPDDKPTRILFHHKASFRALTNDKACEQLERALVSKLGWEHHTYRMTWDQQADVATLERWTDPLAKVSPALPVDRLTKVELTALPIGVTGDGGPLLLNLSGGRHTLLVGATGAGKSSVLHGAMRAAAPAIGAGLLQLRGVCPKGGAELGKARPLFYDLAAGPVNSKGPAAAFELPEGANLLLAEHQRQLDLLVRAGYDCLMRAYRLGAQGVRQHVPSVEEPAVWVMVDEIALMTAYLGTKADKELAAMSMAALLTQGRAWNFHLFGALQDPRMKTLEFRNLFPVRIGLRLDSKGEVAMTLGPEAADAGARCDKINPATPGVLFVWEDGSTVPTRGRAAYVTDADIEDICRRFPAPAWEPPEQGPLGDLREAVATMVPAGVVEQVGEALEEMAEAPAPAKRAAKRRPATNKPAPGTPSSSDAPQADRVNVGDTLVLVGEDGSKFNGTVARVEVIGDRVLLAGPGWEREVDACDTMRRVFFD